MGSSVPKSEEQLDFSALPRPNCARMRVRQKYGLKIAAVDLFCGAGGKTHGFIKQGIPVVAGVDIDPTCAFAFEANNAGAKFHCINIDELDSNEVAKWYPKGAIRVLIGCAPCQPFSTYSYRYSTARQEQQDHDVRWTLLSSFSRLIRELRPEIVTAENVPQLAQLKHPVYMRFISGLKRLGYKVTTEIIKCADYGVPQTRERLIILASRLGPICMIPPTHTSADYATVRTQIGHLTPIEPGGDPPPEDSLHRSAGLSPINLRRIRATPSGGGWQDWPKTLQLACHKKESGRTYPSVYGRMEWDNLAPTITTQCFGLGNGRFGHPTQDRAISLREAALLQTFPADYQFVPPGKPVYFKIVGRHIGNAVPVNLGAAIARSINNHLEKMALPDDLRLDISAAG